MHTFVILIILEQHLVSSSTILRWFHKIWSRSDIKELLHLVIAFLNLVIENRSHYTCQHNGILLSNCVSMGLSWAKLYNWYRACHRLLNSLYRQILNSIAFIAGSFCFLTQFIRFYSFYQTTQFLEFYY